jgi:predicted acylesterase/phospholipase RssA
VTTPTNLPGRPLSLVLCGGGITGAMYEFGALQALDHFLGGAITVNDFDIYVGTSGGAVVAALLANGVPPGDVGRAIVHNSKSLLNFRQEDIVQIDWREMRRAFWRTIRAMPALFRHFRRHPRLASLSQLVYTLEEYMPPGLYGLDRYRDYLHRLLTGPGCSDEFETVRRELYIPSIHLDTGDRILFGSPGWRDVPISLAITASSALPLYFQPVSIRGMDFVDGGVGSVAHLDLPLERGSRFILLINPVIPIRNEKDLVCIPTFTGHCARLREKGVSFVVDQAQRISARQRLLLGLDRFRTLYPEARLFLIEPSLRDAVLFMENILNYGSRVGMLDYGYRSTAALLRSRFETFKAAFASCGIEVSLDHLREDDPWAAPAEKSQEAVPAPQVAGAVAGT